MAGGAGKYRHLSRDSAHRQALLRNLVTSLFENESITTTWAKAKEAQRLADQLITLGKKNTEASRRRALQIFYVRDSEGTRHNYHARKLNPTWAIGILMWLILRTLPLTKNQKPHSIIHKLFGPLRERYADRPGGYTRVLRIEPKQKYEYYSVRKGDKNAEPERKPNDQAPSAILELVDGPKDMRFAMTVRAVARQRELGLDPHPLTKLNVEKVTRYRKGGAQALEEAVRKLQMGDKEGAAKELEELENAGHQIEGEGRTPEEERAEALAKKVDALSLDGKGKVEGCESQVHDQKQRV